MKEDLTNKVCPRCHEVLDECQCDEEPKVREWDDLTNTWQTGETAL